MAKLNKLTTKAVTNILEDWFLDFGKPLRIRSDGGSQFRSEFDEWCEEMGIVHDLTSADPQTWIGQKGRKLGDISIWRRLRLFA